MCSDTCFDMNEGISGTAAGGDEPEKNLLKKMCQLTGYIHKRPLHLELTQS